MPAMKARRAAVGKKAAPKAAMKAKRAAVKPKATPAAPVGKKAAPKAMKAMKTVIKCMKTATKATHKKATKKTFNNETWQYINVKDRPSAWIVVRQNDPVDIQAYGKL